MNLQWCQPIFTPLSVKKTITLDSPESGAARRLFTTSNGLNRTAKLSNMQNGLFDDGHRRQISCGGYCKNNETLTSISPFNPMISTSRSGSPLLQSVEAQSV